LRACQCLASACKIQNLRFRLSDFQTNSDQVRPIQNSEFRIQNSDSEFRIQTTVFQTLNSSAYYGLRQLINVSDSPARNTGRSMCECESNNNDTSSSPFRQCHSPTTTTATTVLGSVTTCRSEYRYSWFGLRPTIQYSEFRIQNSEFRIQN